MTSPLSALDGRKLDVVVLGGGISGAATARELSIRGFTVALIEPRDVAWGTSGRSSRLIHGGLRYLAGGHLGLVRESLRARLELIRAAPHLVRPCPFVVPFANGDPWGWSVAARFGIKLYELLAFPREGWPAPRRIEPEEARILLPGFDPGRFQSAILFHDGWTDDRRLTLATALDARRVGASVATRCELVALDAETNGAARATFRDRLTGEIARTSVRALINATGAWVDRIRAQLGLGSARGRISLVRPTRGTHLAAAGRIDGAALLRHPRDGRVVFLVPALGSFLVGTTDEDDERPPDEIDSTLDDVVYLQELLSHSFPEDTPDVRTSFAGLRPLVRQRGDPDSVSRKSRFVAERVEGVPIVSIVGGKLTLHRPMAARAADLVERSIGSPQGSRPSVDPLLPGGDIASPPGEEAAARSHGLTSVQARWMVGRYGSMWREVLDSTGAGRETLGSAEIPFTAEIAWAVREESVRTVSDLLLRFRLPEIVDDDGDVPRRAAELMGSIEGWSATRIDRELVRWRRDRRLVYGGHEAGTGGGS